MTDLTPIASIPIRCPYCGFRLEKEISYIKKHPTFPCPKCKSLLTSHSEEIIEAIAAITQQRDKVKKLLGLERRKSDT
jgi:DNA-directed RNA polymerase subunit RPC12/RpoP